MFLTEAKLKQRIKELEPYRYLNRTPIGNWRMKEDTTKEEKYPPQVTDDWQEFPVGSRWEGRDYYLWLQTELIVPELEQGEDFVLLFYFGQTGGGHNSGFESLLYIDGEPYQGVDSNHTEVFVDAKYSGQKIQLALKLWSGLEGGGPKQIMCHRFEYGDYAILSPVVDDLYYTASVMLDTVLVLPDTDAEHFALLNLLEETFARIDWTVPGDERFYQSIVVANEYINEAVDGFVKNTPVTVTAVGHTHIDVAWLWRLKHTREKCARSFSTALKLMERYPEFIFQQCQPQVYDYIKKDYPEIYGKMKERIAQGTWEVDGAMWVEADCNISSGESLVRQILHGSRLIKEEFGKDVTYLWLPDVFGYSWALPQILKKSGIDTFMTTKISWNQYNRMPHDTFIWRGIDGSEVLTHFITTPDPNAEAWFYTYNGVLEPSTVKGIYKTYRNKDFNSNLLLSYGYGDGGGGVNREMLEKRRRLDKMPGLPNVKTGRAGDYFKQLQETVANTDNYVHTWDGELYLEYHRGTYTSQAFVKKWNRKLELALRDMEILHTWAGQMKSDWQYPRTKINEGWEVVLRNQFHDIIPGSSIPEVYEDAKEEYQGAAELTVEMKTDFNRDYLQPDKNSWTVLNSAGWTRNESHFIPVTESGYFVDANQQVLTSVKVADGYQVELPEVAPLSSKVVTFVPGESGALTKDACPFQINANDIETPFYKICWNEAGQLTGIYDLCYNRQVLKSEGLGNYLRLFEDKPLAHDAWDIDIYYVQKSKVLAASKIQVVSLDALSAQISFTYEFGQSTIVQTMILYSTSPRIDFKTHVNWQERQQLLKASFDVDIRATEATYNIQYGSVKRSTHWNTSWDMARFESVAHQWVDFSERDYGVALLNDCKYGYNVKDHTMSISLLKGAIFPDPTADLGEHEFTYSLLPHIGDFVTGKVTEAAWSLNSPLQVLPGRDDEATFIKVDSCESVAIAAIKRREDGGGIILRVYDHTGSKRKIMLTPQFVWTSWQETTMMEEPIGEAFDVAAGDIYLELNPYEVKTIWIR